MSRWKKVQISRQNIQAEAARAVLIKMPRKSEYKGYVFWHPSKLVREGKNSNALSLSYTNEFIFRLMKYGGGQYNKYEIIDVQELDSYDFEKAFRTMDENTTGPGDNDDSYLIVDEPERIHREVTIDDELINREAE